MPTNTNIQKKLMLDALEKSLGIVSSACKSVGINRTTHYDWYNRDPKYRASVDALQEVVLDFAESQLFKSINNGSDAATIFFLKTKGKKRGYIEKSEIGFTDKDGNDATAAVIYLPENGRNANQANNTAAARIPGEGTEQPG